MSLPFNAKRGLIIVQVEVVGPSSLAILSLALDTGATGTLISRSRLTQLGYDLSAEPNRARITTGSGVESVPRISVSQITALGESRTTFPVLCHTLPPSANVDGLLGLDFFREKELLINFRTGQISLS